MRSKTDLFAVNGKPLLVPDAPATVNYTDLESSDSGRDETGVMHRVVIRHKVPAWNFSYSHLTDEEKQYMESIFPDDPSFVFRHPPRGGGADPEETQCYLSNYGISLKNTKTGLWSGYSFTITAC